MIIDKIENLNKYDYIQGIDKVINFFKNNDVLNIENGKYDLGDSCSVKVSNYATKEESEELLFEAHNEYLDVQIALTGEELLYFQAIELGEQAIPYNKEKDIEFFKTEWYNSVCLSSGLFALIFPNDLHVGGIKLEESTQVKKLVFKLKI